MRLSLKAISAAVAVVTLLFSSLAGAQRGRRKPPPEPGVRVLLESLGDVENPYRYRVGLELDAWERAEVVADRRLLSLRVRSAGGRTVRTCQHVDAPKKVSDERIRTLGRGERWEEWVDLRMLCWGRALRALEAGGTAEVTFGFAQKGRGRWVARKPPDEQLEPETTEPKRRKNKRKSKRKAEETHRLRGLEVELPSVVSDAEAQAEESPVVVSMDGAEGRGVGSLSFRVTLRARSESVVIYPRFDLWRFRIKGPEGEQECRQRRVKVVPIIDFYSKIERRRGWSERLDASRFCRGGFRSPGIYEVVPIVDLEYSGERYNLKNVIMGTYEGEPVPIRVPAGERYIEHPIVTRAP